jgi:hypothetical protein
MQNNYEGGNVDLRVPYIGYSSESESYTAAGIAAYHALTSHLEKRLSHGFVAGVSYTYSHATDEQSGWASSTTATIPPICAAAMVRPTSTAPTCSTSLTATLMPKF